MELPIQRTEKEP